MPQVAAAFFGTIAFALLFHVPKQYYFTCGIIGGLGWFCYLILYSRCSPTEASFFATLVVVILSRYFAIREKCPVTIFLIAGIFPLVPGAGIYWTAYYLLTSAVPQAAAKGIETVKIAVAIVLGIIFVFELPQKFFQWGYNQPTNRGNS